MSYAKSLKPLGVYLLVDFENLLYCITSLEADVHVCYIYNYFFSTSRDEVGITKHHQNCLIKNRYSLNLCTNKRLLIFD